MQGGAGAGRGRQSKEAKSPSEVQRRNRASRHGAPGASLLHPCLPSPPLGIGATEITEVNEKALDDRQGKQVPFTVH